MLLGSKSGWVGFVTCVALIILLLHHLLLMVSRCLHTLLHYQSHATVARYDEREPVTSTIAVREGQTYGPPESELSKSALPVVYFVNEKCKCLVDFVASCGHVLTGVPCFRAFAWTKKDPFNDDVPPKCKEKVKVLTPVCGHLIDLECTMVARWTEFNLWDETVQANMVITDTMINRAGARTALLPPELSLASMARRCRNTTRVAMECGAGHFVEVPCADLPDLIVSGRRLKCEHMVDRLLACQHTVKVKCSQKLAVPPPTCTEANALPFEYPCGRHTIFPATCARLTELRAAGKELLCPEMVTCKRYRCGHEVDVKCHIESSVRMARPGDRLAADAVVNESGA
jgi:hypothetical protein